VIRRARCGFLIIGKLVRGGETYEKWDHMSERGGGEKNPKKIRGWIA